MQHLRGIDSVTQIVLGAAVGELVAGRKMGNRAMIWGAVAGTIPDLDIFAGLAADPITDLAFHRCVTHSLYYAVLASPVLAWMAKALYAAGGDAADGYLWRYWLPGAGIIYLLIALGSFLSPTPLHGIWAYSAVVAGATVAYPLLVWTFRKLKPRTYGPQVSYRTWMLLFLLCIGTHPLLDCFTTYGTQVLQPFDDLRVAWNTISVADPAYTLPFLLLLLLASRLGRRTVWRKRLVTLGVAVSSCYLVFTCYNLWRVRAQVEESLQDQGITYERFVATPTLLQNIVWNVTIDQGDTLLSTGIGLFDDPFVLPPKQDMRAFSQGAALLEPIHHERAVRVATWFADGYHAVSPGVGDTLHLADLRFGLLPGNQACPIFAFQLYPRGEGEEWGLRQGPMDRDFDPGEVLGSLWERVWGRGE